MTEYGTRHLVDLRDPENISRMCLPGPSRSAHDLDGRWQARVGGVGEFVTIGQRMRFLGPGWQDWYLTSFVLSARVLAEDEIPEPTGPVAYAPPPDDVDDSTEDL